MTPPNILELARQGDARAITSLLNRSLQPKGITAKAAKREGVLHVLLEGEAPPSEAASTKCIQQGLQKLGFVDTPVTIYGRERGNAEVCWQSYLDAPLTDDGPNSSPESASAVAPSLGASDELAPSSAPRLDSLSAAAAETAADTVATWDDFDLSSVSAEGGDRPLAQPLSSAPLAASYPSAEASWDNDTQDDFGMDSLDEPTLIVPRQPEDSLESELTDEDSDSEILLSLWDDADIDEDDLVGPSGDGNEPDLWRDGNAGDRTRLDPALSADSPRLIGEAQPKQRAGAAVLPLVLLALLGVLGGAATASRLGVLRLPWLTNLPGVGKFLTPTVDRSPTGGSAEGVNPASSGSSGTASGEARDPQLPPISKSNAGSSDAPNPDSTASGDDTNASSGESPEGAAAAGMPFRDAVNAATKAATLAQIAQSTDDWTTVAEYWADAVEGMKAVPAGDSQHNLAQSKVTEYQKNLDYARRLAGL